MKDEGKMASGVELGLGFEAEAGGARAELRCRWKVQEGLFVAGEKREMLLCLCDRGVRGKFASFFLGEP
jgi:hypothetical protein